MTGGECGSFSEPELSVVEQLRAKAKPLQEWMDSVEYVMGQEKLIPRDREVVARRLVLLDDVLGIVEAAQTEQTKKLQDLLILLKRIEELAEMYDHYPTLEQLKELIARLEELLK